MFSTTLRTSKGCSVPWTRPESIETRRWTAAIVWVLLVLVSMVLIGCGLLETAFFIWAPEPAMLGRERTGGVLIAVGSALSVEAAVWSHVRGNPLWVTICVGLPGVLVGWAALADPYSLLRHVAAVVSFPLALSGVAEVIWAGGRRQKE